MHFGSLTLSEGFYEISSVSFFPLSDALLLYAEYIRSWTLLVEGSYKITPVSVHQSVSLTFLKIGSLDFYFSVDVANLGKVMEKWQKKMKMVAHFSN